ncbi:phosphatidylinositol 4,5-biphosphate-dependent ARF1 GTPase-activating protein [Trichinella spiralis]|uniref:phosphatidylinositol 4,5-biphosphate-dependent ARF1 GTPase-activating protein n=1 Tax=Trichinella spiralis TaxID=6334 RepID=UPI0001EFCFFF|nr:phosphatidylinositol 4,5-biphosphate-dependent ARF1 GTPase-activating protein [Trichinella spiralis]
MQITISIKVPYRRLGCTRSFDVPGKIKVNTQSTRIKTQTVRSRTIEEKRSLLNFQSEQCISPGHTVSWHRLEFIVSKKFQCTKTGFQRCSMQITIAIKGALSSVRVHSYEQ